MEWNFTLPAHSQLNYTLPWQNQTDTGNLSDGKVSISGIGYIHVT